MKKMRSWMSKFEMWLSLCDLKSHSNDHYYWLCVLSTIINNIAIKAILYSVIFWQDGTLANQCMLRKPLLICCYFAYV